MNILSVISAIRANEELPNATGVKWAGLVGTVVSLVLTAAFGFALSRGWLHDQIPPEQIYMLSSALVSLVLGALGYVQVATSKRIGVGRGASPGGQPERLRELPSDPDDQPRSAAQTGEPSARRQRDQIVDGPFGF